MQHTQTGLVTPLGMGGRSVADGLADECDESSVPKPWFSRHGDVMRTVYEKSDHTLVWKPDLPSCGSKGRDPRPLARLLPLHALSV